LSRAAVAAFDRLISSQEKRFSNSAIFAASMVPTTSGRMMPMAVRHSNQPSMSVSRVTADNASMTEADCLTESAICRICSTDC